MTIEGSFKSQSFKQWEIAQLDSQGAANTTVKGLRVQALLEATFLLYFFFCSNTIQADLTE